MQAQARQMAERRQRILAAARTIVAERGFEALTMRALARASRVTVPTVYNLIGGKDAVLAAAVEERTARFLEHIERRPGAEPAARLLSVVDACVDELLRLPAYYRTLLPLLYRSDAAARVRARVDRALGAALEEALASLDGAGALVDWADARSLVASLRSHLGASALRWAGGALDDDAFHASAVYEACLLLLGVSHGASRATFGRAARAAQTRLRAAERSAQARLRARECAGPTQRRPAASRRARLRRRRA